MFVSALDPGCTCRYCQARGGEGCTGWRRECGWSSKEISVKRFNLVLGIALGDAEHALIRQAVGVTYNIVALGYSRKDEYLADSLGLKYAVKAGYNFKGAISLLGKLKKFDEGGGLVFLRSHPEADSRIEKLEEKIKDL